MRFILELDQVLTDQRFVADWAREDFTNALEQAAAQTRMGRAYGVLRDLDGRVVGRFGITDKELTP
jgi:hypothetical protein